jgi:hypothetical protein
MRKPMTPKITTNKFHQVRFHVGNQSFDIGGICEDAAHAKWLVKMLSKALNNANVVHNIARETFKVTKTPQTQTNKE